MIQAGKLKGWRGGENVLDNISQNCCSLGPSLCLQANSYPQPSKEKGFIETIKLENQYPSKHTQHVRVMLNTLPSIHSMLELC